MTRDAGVPQRADAFSGDQRCFLGGLGQNRVADGQCSGDLTGENRQREIPRRDAREYAAPVQLQRIGFTRRRRQSACARKQALRLCCIVTAEIYSFAYLIYGVLQTSPRFMRDLIQSGVTYGLIATEIPDGTGFNWRTDPEWRLRFQNCNKVAAGAAFIWAQIECTMPHYAQFAPTSFTALGFSERLVPNYIDEEPSRDFCFFGLRTPYRVAAIEHLRRHAEVEWPETMLSAEGVGDLIARSRIGISFKQSPQWPVPSPPRLGRLMLAKRGVAAEHVPIATEQGEIAGLCPPDRDFVDYALSMLDGNWRKRAETTFETYRARMPMKVIMERALDESLGGARPGSRFGLGTPAVRNPASPPFPISPEQEPRLVDRRGDFNILLYNDRYYAISAAFTWTYVSPLEIEDFPIQSESLEHLRELLDQGAGKAAKPD